MSQNHETLFMQLVETSWKKHEETVHNRRMDDLLVGAVISVMVETNSLLIDLTSDGTAHYLRFENPSNQQRLIFQLTNMSENLITAKVLGRHARVVIGYGEQVHNVATLYRTLKSEIKSDFLETAEPGIITSDADIDTGYIYVQVPLILDLDKYFTGDYAVNYGLLRQHIDATMYSLQKYLHGRLQA